MTRSLRNTVHVSLEIMAEKLLCFMGTVTSQTPRSAYSDFQEGRI